MKELFICEKCETIFEDLDLCLNHERECGKENVFECFKCEKIIKWRNNDSNAHTIKNQIHHVDLGTPGYGSEKFDNKKIQFDICENCLYEFISTFKIKDHIIDDYSELQKYYLKEMLRRMRAEFNKMGLNYEQE